MDQEKFFTFNNQIDALVATLKKAVYADHYANKTITELLDEVNRKLKAFENQKCPSKIQESLTYLLKQKQRYNEIGRRIIPHMTSEELGFCLNDKSDKTDVLVNFTDKELLAELFSRDSDVYLKSFTEKQIADLLSKLLETELSDDLNNEILEYVVNTIPIPDFVKYLEEELLLDATITRCKPSDILTALSESLN